MVSTSFFNKNKPIKSLPYPTYFLAVAALAITGLIVSIYLSLSHYKVYTDIGYRSFCAISKAINCDTVSQSPYSIFLNVPIPVWGAIGYAFVIILLLFALSREANQKRIWTLIFLIAFAFSCFSVILAFISSYFVGSYCILCIVTYGVNLLLWLYAWLIRRRFSGEALFQALMMDLHFLWKKKIQALVLFMPLFFAMILSVFFFPAYWNLLPPPLSPDIPAGITEEGHPWIGAENPKLVVVEFADYQCFQCKKMHFLLRQLVAKYPAKLRLVHRNYPMDHEFNFIVKDPFHVGSGKMALLAIYAASVGKFWEMNDALFDLTGKTEEIDIIELANKIGLDPAKSARALNSPILRQKLKIDIWNGMKYRIIGTPSYLIDGRVYQGEIPPEILLKISE